MVLFSFVYASCARVEPEQSLDGLLVTEYKLYAATLRLPEGLKTEVSEGPHYQMHRIFSGTPPRQVLFVCDTSHPPFPMEAPDDAKRETVRINGVPSLSYRWHSEKGLCREVLVGEKSDKRIPNLLHMIYVDISEAEARIADAIIESALLDFRFHR